MCHDCIILRKTDEKLYADCCQQLADNLRCRVSDLPMDEPRDTPLEPNECLCWIDWAEIARERNMTASEPSYDSDDPYLDSWVLRENRP